MFLLCKQITENVYYFVICKQAFSNKESLHCICDIKTFIRDFSIYEKNIIEAYSLLSCNQNYNYMKLFTENDRIGIALSEDWTLSFSNNRSYKFKSGEIIPNEIATLNHCKGKRVIISDHEIFKYGYISYRLYFNKELDWKFIKTTTFEPVADLKEDSGLFDLFEIAQHNISTLFEVYANSELSTFPSSYAEVYLDNENIKQIKSLITKDENRESYYKYKSILYKELFRLAYNTNDIEFNNATIVNIDIITSWIKQNNLISNKEIKSFDGFSKTSNSLMAFARFISLVKTRYTKPKNAIMKFEVLEVKKEKTKNKSKTKETKLQKLKQLIKQVLKLIEEIEQD